MNRSAHKTCSAVSGAEARRLKQAPTDIARSLPPLWQLRATMPVPVAAKVGVVALSVAVAAAIAVYESPELQRMAADLRRRIAIALHSFGDSISPEQSENLFNRPEDAEGFLMSRGLGPGSGEQGVDADEETRRRQREELMYWNAVMEEKRREKEPYGAEAEKAAAEPSRPVGAMHHRGSSFDDFLRQDENAEKGTFVVHTGSMHHGAEGMLRRRGDGARGLIASSTYSNPFLDEHAIDEHVLLENSLVDPIKDEYSDIYSATDIGEKDVPLSATLSPARLDSETPAPVKQESEPEAAAELLEAPQPLSMASSAFSERELGPDEYVTAGQDRDEADQHNDAYSSIQAWAQTSHPGFYSPLPVTPAAPISEPELISDGQLTPTDTASLAGSGVDIVNDLASVRSGSQNARYYDVLSEDEGIMTPASWSEVGSVAGESEGVPVHA
ncbi:uncharacterized protein B0I36DRAFT_349239 [Microdochium trichocladiopsis]|uniref:Transmembrane protein n=1 Tax=Microdochium trichocladiopsis TaxID=1682393 RepID=A0A9P9BQP7_9PEZI|nr:uncharacterized protein B0I36DRAFT_349239 [Microdochium trichocladiopsis]KAH7031113.1 hypothetical protein B0I36DRAFT_349239 [Microdochium trichocladiopsis]